MQKKKEIILNYCDLEVKWTSKFDYFYKFSYQSWFKKEPFIKFKLYLAYKKLVTLLIIISYKKILI